MSLESCGASWECGVRVKEEPGLEHEASVKQEEGWEPVKQEPSEAAASGLYAGHELKGELVLGPTTLQPPDVAFATTVFRKNTENTHSPPAARAPRPGPRRPDQLRLRACSVRLERLSPAEDKRAHSTILGASVEGQTNDGIKPKGLPGAGAASELYSCDACGAQFTRKQNLIQHIQRFSQKSSLRNAERAGPPPAEERGHPAGAPRPGARRPDQLRLRACSVRLERLSPAEDKRTHSTILGASVEGQTNDGIKPKGPPGAGAASELFSCDACGEQFSRKQTLIRHIQRFSQKCKLLVREHIHRSKKPYKCEICLKLFSRRHGLQIHKRFHTCEKPYKCEICLKQFSHSPSLQHHKRIHSGEKPYKCNICLRQFSYHQNLQVHKRIHTGEKPYKCEICLIQFSKSNNLAVHKRIHSGEKPYKCDTCLKQFSHSQNLQVHKRIHTGEKPYKCEICLKQFSKSNHLTVHKRIHSGEKPYKCKI